MKNQEIYNAINQTERTFPKLPLHQVVDLQSDETPDAVAVLFEDQSLNYAELQSRSNQLAHHLQGHGIGRGDLVGVCCERNLDVPILLLGILKTGAAYVPLDPEYPVDRLEYMIENSALKHIVGHQQQSQLIERFGVESTIYDRANEQISRFPTSGPKTEEQSHEDLAYVIYTSGSTGKPKGVSVPHDGVVNFCAALLVFPGFIRMTGSWQQQRFRLIFQCWKCTCH